jgi:hypothetical protein
MHPMPTMDGNKALQKFKQADPSRFVIAWNVIKEAAY